MIPVELRQWAVRHNVTDTALLELSGILGAVPAPTTPAGESEAKVQSRIRLAGPSLDMRLWRNNVGVLKREDGTPIRFGLGNDSAPLNKRLKSSDLVGWRKVFITADMVGTIIAQFVAIECKQTGWKYTGADREEAQQRFLNLVAVDGGYGRFATDPADL